MQDYYKVLTKRMREATKYLPSNISIDPSLFYWSVFLIVDEFG